MDHLSDHRDIVKLPRNIERTHFLQIRLRSGIDRLVFFRFILNFLRNKMDSFFVSRLVDIQFFICILLLVGVFYNSSESGDIVIFRLISRVLELFGALVH